jgi:hypothetical protein
VTRRVPSPRNDAVTRANKTPPPFPRPFPTRPVPTIASAGCVSRTEETADLSAHVDLRQNKSNYSLPQRTNHPSTCVRGHLQLDGQYPQRAHHCGGGSCCPTREVITIYIICFIYYFLFYANPLPSSIPPPLNLHNRQVDDCVADDE